MKSAAVKNADASLLPEYLTGLSTLNP